MISGAVLLIRLILAHLLTDFILQPKSRVADRTAKHFASKKLYLHGFVTAATAFIFSGFQYWWIAVIIFITHVLTDGWKSFQKPTPVYFLIDQFIHIAVIVSCWGFVFLSRANIIYVLHLLNTDLNIWKIITGVIFLTAPSAILTGQLTKQWRDQIENPDSLANAGKWIGMIERIIILVFVLHNQYSAIGLLVAAKGIIRFNEKDRQEIKTEYLVIGTLISIGLAVITGLMINL